MPNNKPYNALTDDDDIHEAEVTVGMKLRDSTVTKVRVEVTESEDRYRIKKFIHLLNGIEIISTYIKTTEEELSELEKVGEISLMPFELEKLKAAQPVKDDSEARAKARAAMAQRKASPTKKPKPKAPPPPPPKPTTFTIHVKMPDGTTLDIPDVKADDTVLDIKKMIKDKENIPIIEQSLFHKGEPLDDKPDSTMNDHGIQEGSVLDLKEAPFAIQINKPDGSTIALPGVKSTDTVLDIKKKIEDRDGIPMDEQSLFHKGRPLDDKPDSTMKDHGIKNGSILDLKEAPFTIKVSKPDGSTVTVPGVRSTDTVLDIKKKIEDRDGIPTDEQSLFHKGQPLDDRPDSTMKDHGIKNGYVLDLKEAPFTIKVSKPDGSTIALPGVKSTDTVLDIKKKIKDQEGIPIDEQSLFHKGQPLDDRPDSTMKDHGIKNGYVLDLKEAPFTIKVSKPDGSTIALPGVKSTDTVLDIKKKIKDQEGIPIDEQSLFHKGQPLDDRPDSTMKDHGIKNGYVLDLKEAPFTIKVSKPDGSTVTVPGIKSTDTVLDIKKKIEDRDGIPIDEQSLFHKGRPLDDRPDSTMKDHGIKNGSILDLKELNFTIMINKPVGETLTIPGVKSTDTVLDIKKKVKDREGIPIDEQWLFYNDKKLDNPTETMKENAISEGSILDLVQPTFTIKVDKPDGTKIAIPNVRPDDTVLDIKKKIEDQEGIPVKGQWLFYNDKPLDEPDVTMDDLGIKDGSTLQLEPMKITVRTPDGRKIPLTVEPSTSIHAVKEMVVDSEAGSLPSVDDVRLSFQNIDLSDPATSLEDYNISNGSVLDLAKMQVRVRKPNGEVFTITALPLDTVKILKQKIESQKRIPINEHKLLFNENLLEDTPTLNAYGIQHGSTLDLDDTIRIKVRHQDGGETKLIPLDIKPKDTIEDIKKRLEDTTGIPAADQLLANNGVTLDDDKEVSNSGIKDDCILDLSSLQKQMQIHIKKEWDGKQFTLDVEKNDSIPSIQERIEEHEGVPKGQQHLDYAGLSLLDEVDSIRKTLYDFGIRHDSVLKLEKMKIYVRSPTGKFTLSENVERNTPLMCIRDMIEKKSKIPPKDQSLSFGKVKLDDGGKTLADYEIQHKCTITLEQANANEPEYDVQLGDWQSSFGFVGKDGVKREGKRKKKKPGMEY